MSCCRNIRAWVADAGRSGTPEESASCGCDAGRPAFVTSPIGAGPLARRPRGPLVRPRSVGRPRGLYMLAHNFNFKLGRETGKRAGGRGRKWVDGRKPRGEETVIDEENWFVRSRIRRDPAVAARTKVVACGGGSFGTAMANLLSRNGYPVSLLVRKTWVRDEINLDHRNPKYLSEYVLPDNVTATCDPEEAFSDAALCVHAIPVQFSRKYIEEHRQFYPEGIDVLCTSKGLECSTLSLMCELIPSILGENHRYAYLSGPSFAKEMMMRLPTAVVIASKDKSFAGYLGEMLSAPYFKVFTSSDCVGLEVAGAIKNVIAIAAGICEGLGLGTNSMAALVTRGCSEMRRIAIMKGASPVTLAGLSGVGDTFLTCFGPLSRNRTVGVRLGRGESLEDILSTSREIAEGVGSAKALVKWLGGSEENGPATLRASLKYPILFGVAAILEGKLTPREGLNALLAMPPRAED